MKDTIVELEQAGVVTMVSNNDLSRSTSSQVRYSTTWGWINLDHPEGTGRTLPSRFELVPLSVGPPGFSDPELGEKIVRDSEGRPVLFDIRLSQSLKQSVFSTAWMLYSSQCNRPLVFTFPGGRDRVGERLSTVLTDRGKLEAICPELFSSSLSPLQDGTIILDFMGALLPHDFARALSTDQILSYRNANQEAREAILVTTVHNLMNEARFASFKDAKLYAEVEARKQVQEYKRQSESLRTKLWPALGAVGARSAIAGASGAAGGYALNLTPSITMPALTIAGGLLGLSKDLPQLVETVIAWGLERRAHNENGLAYLTGLK